MKIIFDKKGYMYDKAKDTAAKLICLINKILSNNKIYDFRNRDLTYMIRTFYQIRIAKDNDDGSKELILPGWNQSDYLYHQGGNTRRWEYR